MTTKIKTHSKIVRRESAILIAFIQDWIDAALERVAKRLSILVVVALAACGDDLRATGDLDATPTADAQGEPDASDPDAMIDAAIPDAAIQPDARDCVYEPDDIPPDHPRPISCLECCLGSTCDADGCSCVSNFQIECVPVDCSAFPDGYSCSADDEPCWPDDLTLCDREDCAMGDDEAPVESPVPCAECCLGAVDCVETNFGLTCSCVGGGYCTARLP
jgi:hypothetical protein